MNPASVNPTKPKRRTKKTPARPPAPKVHPVAAPSGSKLPSRSNSRDGKGIDRVRKERNRHDLRHLYKILATLNNERMSYVREFFGPCHLQVLGQIVIPNYEAWVSAMTEQAWDEATDYVKDGPVLVEVRFEHMAKGLRMDLATFEECVSSLKTGLDSYIKTGVVREHLDPDISRQLAAVFGIQPIPLAVDVAVARRFLTKLALHHRTGVTAEVAAMLKAVGVEPPQGVAARQIPPASCTPKKLPLGT